jgi:short-subunit dehydrogenase
MEPAGSRVLVTGASSGIGAATARLLAKRGATVGIVGRRTDKLSAVLADCQAAAPESRMWVADLGDLDLAEAIALEAWSALGGLDVLINNAAVPKVRPATVLTPADVEHAMRVNFLSPVRMTLKLLPLMLDGTGGVIVNVASVGGRMGIAHEAAYTASKFALTGWSESLAIDLHGTNVAVRLLHPGPIDTDIWDRPGEEHAVYDGPKLPPEIVAEGIVETIAADTFEHYYPDLRAVVVGKDADIDSYIAMSSSFITARERTAE